MKKNNVNLKLYEYEKKFWNKNLLVCGIDEVGRGCLAGPVVTATAILHKNKHHPLLIDSKLLSPKKLQIVYQWLIQNCTYSLGMHCARTIDKKNIYQTTQFAMKQALQNLFVTTKQQPSIILVDAMPLNLTTTPYYATQSLSMIKGESKSASIAAASIIAKVTRDTILKNMTKTFPAYNFTKHKGYGTKEHKQSLQINNPSIIHRHTFLKNFIAKKDQSEQQTIF